MDVLTEGATLIQHGLEVNAETMKMMLLAIQTGYNLRAMEQPSTDKQDKQAS